MQNTNNIIEIEHITKKYRLGTIGGGTLRAALQTKWAKLRGKEDPNLKVDEKEYIKGEEFWALSDINLSVKRGEAVGIIGHNGAGKSTLLKLLCRVTAPTEGHIKINGRIASMLEVGTGFHPELTGRENIYMNGAILGMSRKEVDAKMDNIIEFSECGDFIDTPVKRYSSGMYVKLAFAVAAHLDADIMIMDEVLAVGDVKFQKKSLTKMGDAAGEEGKTVLYVSHNMNTIRQLCTRCIVLSHGRVIYDGDVEEAIKIYSEDEKGDLVNYYDFAETKRPPFGHGKDFFINNFSFLDVEKPIYKNDQEIVWEMEYTSKKAFEGLGVYYTVFFEDSTIAGTMQCSELGCIEAGETKKCRFSMDVSNLVEGTYYFSLDVFYKNEFNTFFSIDHPNQKIYFEVLDKDDQDSIIWRRKDFGNVRLNPLKVLP